MYIVQSFIEMSTWQFLSLVQLLKCFCQMLFPRFVCVSSYSVCPDLILMALERKDYFLCQLCLQFFPDIPEAATCACLKAFIR